MAHINLDNSLPGISGLLRHFPETAKPLTLLAETLLRAPNNLTSGERELIAGYVSYKNNCNFCHLSHSAAAAAHLKDDFKTTDQIIHDIETADISDKMKALLHIAAQVQQSGKAVQAASIERAKDVGATDDDIHTTVLIAAAFCMYNRYVDGLGTWTPLEREAFVESGKRLAEVGYVG
jgi:uncharacterized peroxidase-related enzyme